MLRTCEVIVRLVTAQATTTFSILKHVRAFPDFAEGRFKHTLVKLVVVVEISGVSRVQMLLIVITGRWFLYTFDREHMLNLFLFGWV